MIGLAIPSVNHPVAKLAIPSANKTDKCEIFYESTASSELKATSPIFHISLLWGYNNPVIATTLSTARRTIACYGPTLRILYLWEPEWMRAPGRWFMPLYSVYRNNHLIVVPASDELSQIYTRVWGGKPAPVAKNFILPAIIDSALEYLHG